ncbi:MAG: hypothetical protein ABWX69_03855 [Arthrobacter sp.]
MQTYCGAAGKRRFQLPQACDTIGNTDTALLQEMSAALAYVAASYAQAARG